MRYAQIIDGNVKNVIIWDGTTDLGLDGDLVELGDRNAGPGWTYDGTNFIAPPQPEPDE